MKFSKWHLYKIIVTFTTLAILTAMGLYSWHLYSERKNSLLDRIYDDSHLTLSSLQKNVAHFIEAYAVQEYELLIESEMQHDNFQVILIEDYNTANIVGEPTYITGRVKEVDNSIREYDAELSNHRLLIEQCFYVKSKDILSKSDEKIGTVTICSTDTKMNQELQSLLTKNLIVGLLISLFLFLTLFLILRHYAIRPIIHITEMLMKHDQYGIPTGKFHESGAYEFEMLSQTINKMVDTVRGSYSREKEIIKTLDMERERFSLAIDGTLDGLWDWDLLTNKVVHSKRFETMLGYSGSELPDTIECWAGLIHPNDLENAQQKVKEYLDNKGSLPYESTFRMHTKSGEWRWITGRGKATFDIDGTPIRFVGFNTDITQKKEHEEKILFSNARYAALNQSLPVGVLIYDTSLESITFANEAAASILEMGKYELQGSDLNDVHWSAIDENGTPLTSENHPTWITLKTAKAQRHIVIGLQFNDHVKWLSINTEPYYVNNELFGVIVSFMDITKERQLIEELNAEQHRFKLAIEGSQDGLWDWNPKTNTVFFSHQWKNMLGYNDDEITDSLSEWSDRVHPDDLEEAMKAVSNHLEGKTKVYEHRHRLQCKDGSWKWILDRGKALFDESGNPLRVVGFHTDITQEIEHQKALEHSAKHDSLTHLPNRFLFNELIQTMLSHAIRNNKSLAIIYIDLDGFKEVNDTFGHKAGDVVLTEVSQRMKELLRQEDIISRLGGDEFVVAVSDITNNEDLIPLLKRLLEVLNEPIAYLDDSIMKYLQVSASIGVSIYPQEIELGSEALLRQPIFAIKS